ncbi:MAG: hypothetical protein NT140_05440 [Deltaproteobacteria bacterium]|nr:hypothetical protein [Deltaproteobacteria bacterium]
MLDVSRYLDPPVGVACPDSQAGGAVYFGESMFTKISNASKAALITLTRALQARGFRLIDCQVDSPHLQSLGAELLPRKIFLNLLTTARQPPANPGRWINWS